MNLKSKMYFLYGVYFIVFLYLAGWFLNIAPLWRNNFFFPSPIVLHILSFIIPFIIFIIFGSSLAIKHILTEFKKKGRWKLNYKKIFILSLLPYLIVFSVPFLLDILLAEQGQYLIRANLDYNSIETLSLVILGYFFTTSIQKE